MKEDWIECKLGEILNIERGGSPRPIKEFITNDENGINWIKISDATNSGKYILKTIQKIKPTGLKNSREVFPGDLLLSNSMSFGKPYIMGINGAIHDGWLVIRDNKFLDKNYLFYALASPITYNQFSQNAKGSTVKNLNIEIVREVTIKVNPLPIQKGIVKKIEELFSSLDSGIADLKKAQEQLVIYRQAVLKKAFDLNDKKYKIEEICTEIFAGGDKPKDFFSDWKTEECSVPIIANAVANNGLYGYTKTARVLENAITIAGRGSGTGNVELRREPFVPIVRLITIIPNIEIVKIEFLMYFLKNLNIKGTGSAIPQLTIPMVKRYEIYLPSLQVQHQIVREIESRLSVCDKVEESLKESLEKAKALRQSILKKAFEGKLLSAEELAKCKADQDYEPASVLLEKIKKEKKKNCFG